MKPDSNSPDPKPPDDDASHREPTLHDDEAIDFGSLEQVEDGASALSFSGRSGSHSGGSASNVRSWQQLVQEAASDSGADYDVTEPDIDIDPISDKDLLRQVLADEPQPSSIILKDPSLGEAPALKSTNSGSPADSFALPPDLAATRPDDSSIISQLTPGVGESGINSDVWDSSRVDLLRPGQPVDLSSGSLARTDELGDPPLVAPPSGDSSHTLLGVGPGDASAGGSAVDLGSHGASDAPFPSAATSRGGSGGTRRPSGDPDPESGTVDLLAAGDEFDLGLADSAASPSWAAAREDLPPTVPMVPAGKARLMSWVGGGAGGLLAGVAICAGLWYAGIVPNQSAKSTPTLTAPANASTDSDWPVRAQSMVKQARDEEAAKAVAATADAKRLQDQVVKLTADLTQAKAAAAQSKEARDRVTALTTQVKQAESAQVALKATVDQLTTASSATDTKLRETEATITTLRGRLATAASEATAAKDKVASAEAAAKQSTTLAADFAQRLRVAPNAPPAEMLEALDRAVTRPAAESLPVFPGRPVASAALTPEQVRQAEHAGFTAYRARNFAGAERDFERLTASPQANAIHWYYLGLAQWQQNQLAEAKTSFQRGWALERSSRPPPGEVEAAFERLDRSDRDAVNMFRR